MTALTPTRRDVLEAARDGRLRKNETSGHYHLSDSLDYVRKQTANELTAAGLLVVRAVSPSWDRPVELTVSGRALLEGSPR